MASYIIYETKMEVEDINKNVAWVGSRDGEFAISWDEFLSINDYAYDSGYGAQHIAKDLVVVFEDGSYLERVEYDGSEAWNFSETPKKSDNPKPFKKLGNNDNMWENLKTINEKGERN